MYIAHGIVDNDVVFLRSFVVWFPLDDASFHTVKTMNQFV